MIPRLHLALTQFDPPSGLENGVDIDLWVGLGGGALGAFATTLVVGAILVAVAPDLLERTSQAVETNPVDSFVYGIVCLVFTVLVTIVLVVTIVGILVAIPFVILSYLVWAVGATVAFTTIAVRLVGREDGWLKPLLLAAALNGLLTLSGIGGLVAFIVGATGFGAVLRDRLE